MKPFTIASLNAGAVRAEIDASGTPYRSAIRRVPLHGPHALETHGLSGDASAYRGHHGPNMTLHVFSYDRYAHYETLAGRAFPVPAFGENFTVDGGTEDEVCIGDRFQIGTAVVAITQPTERCATPGRALGVPSLRKAIEACRYSGYYMRVVRPGIVSAGDEFGLLDRPQPQWSVDRVNYVFFHELEDDERFAELIEMDELSADWKARMHVMRARLAKVTARRSARRLPLIPS